MKKIKKETQLVRIEREVKEKLDAMVKNKQETYSDIIRRLTEDYREN
tara:strand:+ start:441 stop:581 length:141 start_codon:yes stop_codon:yes gene_type:complete